MTMREEFLLWWVGCGSPNTPATLIVCEDAWKAAYRAGQEAMRESSARLPEVAYAASTDEQKRLNLLAANIRGQKIE
jgi:hypothetical protein